MTGLVARWFRRAQQLFQLLIGLVFLVLAGAGGMVTWQEWLDYRRTAAGTGGAIRFGVMAAFTVFLVILGLYSFAKARSVR